MATLTAKQQRFVAEYLVDQNATQAAIRAGYSKKTAGQVGFENLKKPELAEAIAKRQAKDAKEAEVTHESLLNELEEARSLAIKEKQTSAAVSATMGKANLTGLLIE
jgi:phage terminase small subunit